MKIHLIKTNTPPSHLQDAIFVRHIRRVKFYFLFFQLIIFIFLFMFHVKMGFLKKLFLV